MKIILLLASLLVMSEAANAVCTTISRTNLGTGVVLQSSRLNTDLNTVYARVNDLPGDCITAESITTTQIDDGTIGTSDIADNAVTNAKLASVNYAISSSDSGTFTTTSTTFVDVTNLTASITTTGRPVEISLIAKEGGGATAICQLIVASSLNTALGRVKFLRGSTSLAEYQIGVQSTGPTAMAVSGPCSSIRYVDVPAAGTYTYKLQAESNSASYSLDVRYARLMVREL